MTISGGSRQTNFHNNRDASDVDTRDGVVTLHGSVPSDIHRDLAGEIAKNAKGVTLVRNELEIVPSSADGSDRAENASGEPSADPESSPVH